MENEYTKEEIIKKWEEIFEKYSREDLLQAATFLKRAGESLEIIIILMSILFSKT